MSTDELKKLAGGVKEIGEMSRERTLKYIKIFEDTESDPYRIALKEIIEGKIKGYYYRLAHLADDERTIIKHSLISGIIQGLEEVLKIEDELKVSKEAIAEEKVKK